MHLGKVLKGSPAAALQECTLGVLVTSSTFTRRALNGRGETDTRFTAFFEHPHFRSPVPGLEFKEGVAPVCALENRNGYSDKREGGEVHD